MKIEEQNPYVSTSPVAMEALYAHYEARGVFGKRNFSLVFMCSPHIIIWESFGLECIKHLNWQKQG